MAEEDPFLWSDAQPVATGPYEYLDDAPPGTIDAPLGVIEDAAPLGAPEPVVPEAPPPVEITHEDNDSQTRLEPPNAEVPPEETYSYDAYTAWPSMTDPNAVGYMEGAYPDGTAYTQWDMAAYYGEYPGYGEWPPNMGDESSLDWSMYAMTPHERLMVPPPPPRPAAAVPAEDSSSGASTAQPYDNKQSTSNAPLGKVVARRRLMAFASIKGGATVPTSVLAQAETIDGAKINSLAASAASVVPKVKERKKEKPVKESVLDELKRDFALKNAQIAELLANQRKFSWDDDRRRYTRRSPSRRDRYDRRYRYSRSPDNRRSRRSYRSRSSSRERSRTPTKKSRNSKTGDNRSRNSRSPSKPKAALAKTEPPKEDPGKNEPISKPDTVNSTSVNTKLDQPVPQSEGASNDRISPKLASDAGPEKPVDTKMPSTENQPKESKKKKKKKHKKQKKTGKKSEEEKKEAGGEDEEKEASSKLKSRARGLAGMSRTVLVRNVSDSGDVEWPVDRILYTKSSPCVKYSFNLDRPYTPKSAAKNLSAGAVPEAPPPKGNFDQFMATIRQSVAENERKKEEARQAQKPENEAKPEAVTESSDALSSTSEGPKDNSKLLYAPDPATVKQQQKILQEMIVTQPKPKDPLTWDSDSDEGGDPLKKKGINPLDYAAEIFRSKRENAAAAKEAKAPLPSGSPKPGNEKGPAKQVVSLYDPQDLEMEDPVSSKPVSATQSGSQIVGHSVANGVTAEKNDTVKAVSAMPVLGSAQSVTKEVVQSEKEQSGIQPVASQPVGQGSSLKNEPTAPIPEVVDTGALKRFLTVADNVPKEKVKEKGETSTSEGKKRKRTLSKDTTDEAKKVQKAGKIPRKKSKEASNSSSESESSDTEKKKESKRKKKRKQRNAKEKRKNKMEYKRGRRNRNSSTSSTSPGLSQKERANALRDLLDAFLNHSLDSDSSPEREVKKQTKKREKVQLKKHLARLTKKEKKKRKKSGKQSEAGPQPEQTRQTENMETSKPDSGWKKLENSGSSASASAPWIQPQTSHQIYTAMTIPQSNAATQALLRRITITKEAAARVPGFHGRNNVLPESLPKNDFKSTTPEISKELFSQSWDELKKLRANDKIIEEDAMQEPFPLRKQSEGAAKRTEERAVLPPQRSDEIATAFRASKSAEGNSVAAAEKVSDLALERYLAASDDLSQVKEKTEEKEVPPMLVSYPLYGKSFPPNLSSVSTTSETVSPPKVSVQSAKPVAQPSAPHGSPNVPWAVACIPLPSDVPGNSVPAGSASTCPPAQLTQGIVLLSPVKSSIPSVPVPLPVAAPKMVSLPSCVLPPTSGLISSVLPLPLPVPSISLSVKPNLLSGLASSPAKGFVAASSLTTPDTLVSSSVKTVPAKSETMPNCLKPKSLNKKSRWDTSQDDAKPSEVSSSLTTSGNACDQSSVKTPEKCENNAAVSVGESKPVSAEVSSSTSAVSKCETSEVTSSQSAIKPLQAVLAQALPDSPTAEAKEQLNSPGSSNLEQTGNLTTSDIRSSSRRTLAFKPGTQRPPNNKVSDATKSAPETIPETVDSSITNEEWLSPRSSPDIGATVEIECDEEQPSPSKQVLLLLETQLEEAAMNHVTLEKSPVNVVVCSQPSVASFTSQADNTEGSNDYSDDGSETAGFNNLVQFLEKHEGEQAKVISKKPNKKDPNHVAFVNLVEFLEQHEGKEMSDIAKEEQDCDIADSASAPEETEDDELSNDENAAVSKVSKTHQTEKRPLSPMSVQTHKRQRKETSPRNGRKAEVDDDLDSAAAEDDADVSSTETRHDEDEPQRHHRRSIDLKEQQKASRRLQRLTEKLFGMRGDLYGSYTILREFTYFRAGVNKSHHYSPHTHTTPFMLVMFLVYFLLFVGAHGIPGEAELLKELAMVKEKGSFLLHKEKPRSETKSTKSPEEKSLGSPLAVEIPDCLPSTSAVSLSSPEKGIMVQAAGKSSKPKKTVSFADGVKPDRGAYIVSGRSPSPPPPPPPPLPKEERQQRRIQKHIALIRKCYPEQAALLEAALLQKKGKSEKAASPSPSPPPPPPPPLSPPQSSTATVAVAPQPSLAPEPSAQEETPAISTPSTSTAAPPPRPATSYSTTDSTSYSMTPEQYQHYMTYYSQQSGDTNNSSYWGAQGTSSQYPKSYYSANYPGESSSQQPSTSWPYASSDTNTPQITPERMEELRKKQYFTK